MKLELSSKDIIDLNREIVGLTGEPHGVVKDYIETSLTSAQYYDNYFDQVAAIVRSLVMNHNFEQGNKRTAAITLATLLPQVDFTDDFLTQIVMNIVEKKLEVEEIGNEIALFAKDRMTKEQQTELLTKHTEALKILYHL